MIRYAIQNNVSVLMHRIQVNEDRKNRRAIARAGASTLAYGRAKVMEKFVIKRKTLSDKRYVKGKVNPLRGAGNKRFYEYAIFLSASQLNVRDYAVKEHWVSEDKKSNPKTINTARVRESRRRARVLRWKFQIKKGQWKTLRSAFALKKAGNRLITRKGKDRLPTRQIFGPSPATLFTSPEVVKQMESHFIKRYQVEYERESNRNA